MIEGVAIDPTTPMTSDEQEHLRQLAYKMATDLSEDWKDLLGPNFLIAADGALDAWAMAFCNLSTPEAAAKILEQKAAVLRIVGQKQKGAAH